jgi:hypothetical protein
VDQAQYIRGCFDVSKYTGLGKSLCAEAIALCQALHHFPLNLPLVIYSDCERLLTLMNSISCHTTRFYLRYDARPILRYLIHKLTLHPQVQLSHVNRNNDRHNRVTRGNKLADLQCKLARSDFDPALDLSPLEYPALLLLKDQVIYGDYRTYLKDHMWEHQLSEWSKCPTQGMCPKSFIKSSHSILLKLKNLIGDKEILRPWFIDTVCNNVPNQHMISFANPPPQCQLCHKHIADTSAHYLQCEFVHDLVKGLTNRIKRLLNPNPNQIINFLSTHLNNLLRSYKTFLHTHYNSISSKLQSSFIHRYCTNITAQGTKLTAHDFPQAINLLKSCAKQNPVEFQTFTSITPSLIFSYFPSTISIVLNVNDIPPTCRNWSFYGFSEANIPTLDKVQWYEHHKFQSFLFLFIISEMSNEFCSLEREITTRCLTGCTTTIFTKFPKPPSYHTQSNVHCVTTWSNKLQVWVWKFRPQFDNLPFLPMKAPPIHRTIPHHLYWDSLQLYQPLFHEQRWIFACDPDNLPSDLWVSLQKWENLNQIAFLLGFFPTDVLTSLKSTSSTLQIRRKIQKSCWRVLRDIYLRRRSAYIKLKKWIDHMNNE